MTEAVTCFMIEPTGRSKRYWRRYGSTQASKCEHGVYPFHNAMVDAGECSDTEPSISIPSDSPFKHAGAWPTHCACGYMFLDSDEWQIAVDSIYRAADGREFLLKNVPPGAMWRATWYEQIKSWVGPDGKSYVVRLPDGTDWPVDGPSSDGGHWTREGAPPALTVRPSILTPKYHGWLTGGMLTPA